MKKLFLIACALMASVSMYAFDFDGINLNGTVGEITKAVAKKNYVTSIEDPNTLTGLCQGTKISLKFNLEDVTEKNRVGQLIIDVPTTSANAYLDNAQLLNVIYHQVSNSSAGFLYELDADGTTLLLSKTDNGIRLTYNTPYYKEKK